MRGTLHLLPSEDAGAYLALLAATKTWTKGSWQKTFLTAAEMDRLTEAVVEALEPGEALTREELVEHLGDTRLAGHVGSGWSAVLKPLAWQGLLCQGPSRGARVTFQRPDAWSKRWRGLPDEDEAARQVVTAYLAAHGPATMAALDQWLMRGTMPKAKLKRWFADLGDAVTTVDVEGTTAYVLAEHEDELRSTKPSTAVRLLPGFDQYVLAPGTGDAAVIDQAHRADVSRAAGWIAPVVVSGGRVVGTWTADGGAPAVDLWPAAKTPATKAPATNGPAADGAAEVPAAGLEAETRRLARLTTRRAPA
jgi:hypothetical protein